MKLKVLKCSDSVFWYNDYIGKYFNVIGHYDDYCTVDHSQNTTQGMAVIHSKDALLFEDDNLIELENAFTRFYEDLNKIAINELNSSSFTGGSL